MRNRGISIIEAGAERCCWVRPFITHLTPEARKARASFKTGRTQASHQGCCSLHRLEALAYWARPALEAGSPTRSQRCPRTHSSMSWFLEFNAKAPQGRSRRSPARLASIDALDNGPLFSGRQDGGLDGRDLVVSQESSRCDTHDGVLGAV